VCMDIYLLDRDLCRPQLPTIRRARTYSVDRCTHKPDTSSKDQVHHVLYYVIHCVISCYVTLYYVKYTLSLSIYIYIYIYLYTYVYIYIYIYISHIYIYIHILTLFSLFSGWDRIHLRQEVQQDRFQPTKARV
jgi:hypothetical protein